MMCDLGILQRLTRNQTAHRIVVSVQVRARDRQPWWPSMADQSNAFKLIVKQHLSCPDALR